MSEGHAGVMLQARQLGKELVVGIHSDEDILEHKGPTVMNLQERYYTSQFDHSYLLTQPEHLRRQCLPLVHQNHPTRTLRH